MRWESWVEVANLVPENTATRGGRPGARDTSTVISRKPVKADDFAADQEGVAGGEGGGEALFNLAQGGAHAAFQADFQGFDVDDGAKVLPDDGGGAGVAQGPFAAPDHQALPAVIGLAAHSRRWPRNSGRRRNLLWSDAA